MINSTFVQKIGRMDIKERIKAFVGLGKGLNALFEGSFSEPELALSLDDFLMVSQSNEWFTRDNIKYAVKSIADNLSEENIRLWLEKYPQMSLNQSGKKVGVVMAGNIPLVGFHDLLCILISGNEAIIKASSKDDKLIKLIVKLLIHYNSEFADLIHFEKEHLKNVDAIIATGSDNTANYFEYYFGKYPHIIRRNRNSIAILTGDESDEELELLAFDMLMYFGLGCRNVSKLYFPEGFDYQRIFKSLQGFAQLMDHNKYANNYTYNRSIYLMNRVEFWENGFVIMKEDIGLSSPISVIFFEYYSSIDSLKQRLKIDKEQIQCIVARGEVIEESVAFGEAQKPQLWDYADNVDTMQFLLELGN